MNCRSSGTSTRSWNLSSASHDFLVAVGDLEHVGHGDELDRAVLDRQGVSNRAATTAAAADQSELDRVVLGGMDGRRGERGQRLAAAAWPVRIRKSRRDGLEPVRGWVLMDPPRIVLRGASSAVLPSCLDDTLIHGKLPLSRLIPARIGKSARLDVFE